MKNRNRRFWKRALAMLLTVCMVMTTLVGNAFAFSFSDIPVLFAGEEKQENQTFGSGYHVSCHLVINGKCFYLGVQGNDYKDNCRQQHELHISVDIDPGYRHRIDYGT